MRCLLFFQFNRTTKRLNQFGFTLLELLVVIALLAIAAGTVMISFDGVQEQGRIDATKFEMAELRKALLQFRRDSGSNDFPTQGVYDCTDFSNGGLATNPNSNFPLSFSASVAAMSNAEFISWCKSTDNFWMLFIDPFERAEANQWNEDTHRGWNGPYIQNRYGAISTSSIDNIPSVISPYQSSYLLFNLDISTASIVSMGENKTSGTITDCSSDDEDDYVVCLLQ
jgi:prepilin-type N-terminal cleavage/methylation domain-containing protein